MTGVTAVTGCSVPHIADNCGPFGLTFLVTALVYNNVSGKGTTMFALIALGATLLVLIAVVGLPYPQTWQRRWGNSDR